MKNNGKKRKINRSCVTVCDNTLTTHLTDNCLDNPAPCGSKCNPYSLCINHLIISCLLFQIKPRTLQHTSDTKTERLKKLCVLHLPFTRR